MQIHELSTYAGTPGASDWFALDTGSVTNKIAASDVGVRDIVTVAEIQAGTSTAERIVTPAVLGSLINIDATVLQLYRDLGWTGSDVDV